MNQHPQPARRGYGLADTLIMMFFIGVLTSMSAIVLNRSFRAQSLALQRIQHTRDLDQAYQRLRTDVRQADAQIQGNTLALQLADRSIRYLVEEERLIRRSKSADDDGVESWQLSGLIGVQWEVEDSEQCALLYCRLEFSPSGTTAETIDWHLRGRDLSPETDDE